MENRSSLSTILITCGTILVVAALVLVGYLNALSAADVRDHRSQSSSLLRDLSIDRVTLSEWQQPTPLSAYATIIGGFFLIHTGIRKASQGPTPAKPSRPDDLE